MPVRLSEPNLPSPIKHSEQSNSDLKPANVHYSNLHTDFPFPPSEGIDMRAFIDKMKAKLEDDEVEHQSERKNVNLETIEAGADQN